MNDLQDQTNNNTWHEGDFEHVSIKVNSAYDPVAVNFYRHEGGRTVSPSDCWWSSANSLTYSGLSQGYSPSRTHLHVWLAANAHGAYNRHEKVYEFRGEGPVDICTGLDPELVIDNVDFDPSGYDLYFQYDYLGKLGEIKQSPLKQASNGQYYPYAHNYYWFDHYEPIKSSKEWLAFVGRFGEFWYQVCGAPIPLGTGTDSPLSPAFGGVSHEWKQFTEVFGLGGFGYPTEDGLFANTVISWIPDIPDGD